MLKLLRETYEYLFFIIYREFVKVYPESLDPKFYTVALMFLMFALSMGMAIVSIWLRFTDLDIPKYIFYIFSIIYFVLHIKYFNKKKVKNIVKTFENTEKTGKYIFVLIIVLFIIFSLIIDFSPERN